MKTFVPGLLGCMLFFTCSLSAIAQPTLTSPEASAPKSRADVIAEISTWRAAGYNPIMDLTHYPDSAQRAAQIIAEQRARAASQPQ